MNIKALLSSLLLLLGLSSAIAADSTKLTPVQYIEKYKSIALEHMKSYKIPASITLAQGMLESGNGNSDLARNANNHFGIKCHKGWEGETYTKDDDAKDECFRKYSSVEESYKDHADFLSGRKRYEALFDLKITDYKGWARGLKKAGYATNPQYASRLISLIERYELQKLDKKPKKEKKRWLIGNSEDSDTADYYVGMSKRKVMTNNGVKFVMARQGESIELIGDELDISPWLLRSYNDMAKDATVSEGDTIYMQAKKRKAEVEFHTVKEGETLHYISQKYGIRLKIISRLNHLDKGYKPEKGVVLYLRNKKPSS